MTVQEITSHGECPYFEGRSSLTSYRHTPTPNTHYATHHMITGWRRFAGTTFRPVCPDCEKCESVRIVALDRPFSKSEKRIIKANDDLVIDISSPQATQAHLDLYHEFHLFRHENRSWDEPSMTLEEYEDQFVSYAGDFGLEARYYEGETLVCVDLFDMGSDGLSSVYCYWKPTAAKRSLGSFSLLWQLILAQRLSLPYVYLGYVMEESHSLRYKYRFKPLQRLVNRPQDHEEAKWEDIT